MALDALGNFFKGLIQDTGEAISKMGAMTATYLIEDERDSEPTNDRDPHCIPVADREYTTLDGNMHVVDSRLWVRKRIPLAFKDINKYRKIRSRDELLRYKYHVPKFKSMVMAWRNDDPITHPMPVLYHIAMETIVEAEDKDYYAIPNYCCTLPDCANVQQTERYIRTIETELYDMGIAT